jgi:FADH2 O2-dependent halogenase
LPLTTFGEWQRTYPEIGCGLKRGFTYYKHEPHKEYRALPDRSNQLLVAASPYDEVADTHWFRSDVDQFLLNEAIALGVVYQDETVSELETVGESGASLSLSRQSQKSRVSCRLLIDATGPRGFLYRALALPSGPFKGFPRTHTVFSHFTDVHRTSAMPQFTTDGVPPYPPDDAALHHVFDDGWMWVLRFGNGITSAGVSVTDSLAAKLNLPDKVAAWERTLARYPTIAAQFADAAAIREFTYASQLSFRSGAAAGEGWAMLPSAVAFVDPLFSTGIPLTLIGIERIAGILEHDWNSSRLPDSLRDYAALTLSDADWTAEFVGGCFAAMPHFPLFTAFSMYYFAAASFSEMARRLDRRDLATRFLTQNRAEFAAGLQSGAKWLRGRAGPPTPTETDAFAVAVANAVRTTNIAGVSDPEKRNWYGIDWNDVIDNAQYLEMTPTEMRRVLNEADWASGI